MYSNSQELPLSLIVKTSMFFKRQILFIGLLASLITISLMYVLFPVKFESDSIIRVNAKQWEETINADPQTKTTVNLNFQSSELLSRSIVAEILQNMPKVERKPSAITVFLNSLGIKKKPVSEEKQIQAIQDSVRVVPTEVPEAGQTPDKYTIRYVDGTPESAVSLTNSLLKLYSDSKKEELVVYYEKIIQSLKDQLATLDSKIGSTQGDLSTYVQNNSGASASLLRQDIMGSLADAKKALSEVKILIAEMTTRRSSLQKMLASEPQTLTSYLDGQTTIKSSGQNLQEAQAELAKLRMIYTEEHPDVVRLKKEIAAYAGGAGDVGGGKPTNSKYRANVSPNPEYQRLRYELSNVEANLVKAQAQKEDLEKAIATTQSRSGETTTITYNMKERGNLIDSLNLLRVNLETRLTNAIIRKQFVQSELVPLVQVVETMTYDKSPPKPRFLMNTLGLGIGLLVGFIVALIRAYLTLSQIQRTHGTIRVIPKFVDVYFLENRINDAGTYDKIYALSGPVETGGRELQIYAGERNSMVSNNPLDVVPSASESAVIIKLTDNMVNSFRNWWYKPCVITGYTGIIILILVEFVKQYYIIPGAQ